MSDIYRHFRTGQLYRVLHHGTHTETGERFVVYRRTGSPVPNTVWVRPADMFYGSVEHDGKTVNRFEKVDS